MTDTHTDRDSASVDGRCRGRFSELDNHCRYDLADLFTGLSPAGLAHLDRHAASALAGLDFASWTTVLADLSAAGHAEDARRVRRRLHNPAGRCDCVLRAQTDFEESFDALLTRLRRPDRRFVVYVDDGAAMWATRELTFNALNAMTGTRVALTLAYEFVEDTGSGTVTFELADGARTAIEVVAVSGAQRARLLYASAAKAPRPGAYQAREINTVAEVDLPLYTACYLTELIATPADPGAAAGPRMAADLDYAGATAFLAPLLGLDPETKAMLGTLMHAMDRPYRLGEVLEMLDLALLPGPT